MHACAAGCAVGGNIEDVFALIEGGCAMTRCETVNVTLWYVSIAVGSPYSLKYFSYDRPYSQSVSLRDLQTMEL